jgi:hypothetical protein
MLLPTMPQDDFADVLQGIRGDWGHNMTVWRTLFSIFTTTQVLLSVIIC